MQADQHPFEDTDVVNAVGSAVPPSSTEGADGGPSASTTNAPSHTLYINRLDERVKEATLRESLEQLFSPFGTILQITAMSSLKRRGQAFVCFAELPSAQRALESLQGYTFLGNPLRIDFATATSDAVAKINGTYQPRVKAKSKKGGAHKASGSKRMHTDGGGDGDGDRPTKKAKVLASGKAAEELPHKILFLKGLPTETTQMMLSVLFQQFPGFQEVRLVPGHDVAFVEYEKEGHASMAKQSLQGFRITPTHTLNITFAKK